MDRQLGLAYLTCELWHKENRKQHVLILNYDITPERGLGARLVYRDRKFNAFITYRQAIRRGIDAFIIIGDPNAEKMQKRALAKIILPLLILICFSPQRRRGRRGFYRFSPCFLCILCVSAVY